MDITKLKRVKCYQCRTFDERAGRWVYKMARITEWKPKPGYDPNLRQFGCPECGGLNYKRLKDYEIEELAVLERENTLVTT